MKAVLILTTVVAVGMLVIAFYISTGLAGLQ
jgi:hypothetical protein